MHTVFALLCFVVVIHWLISPYPSGLLHWHCGNLTIAPVPAKQPWWIWINTSCEFIMTDCITTTKQSTTKPCAYFLGYTVNPQGWKLGLVTGVNIYILVRQCDKCHDNFKPTFLKSNHIITFITITRYILLRYAAPLILFMAQLIFSKIYTIEIAQLARNDWMLEVMFLFKLWAVH